MEQENYETAGRRMKFIEVLSKWFNRKDKIKVIYGVSTPYESLNFISVLFFYFREGGKGRERDIASYTCPTRDRTCNLGMCSSL